MLFLRDLKDFLGVTMKIRPAEDAPEGKEVYIFSCVGIGYSNIAKKT